MIRLVLAFLILFSSVAFAQKPPRNAKSVVITIDTASGKEEALNAIANYLLSESYEIDLINTDLGLVQTKDAALKYAHWKHRLSATLIGNTVRFSGKAIVKDIPMDIENKGSLGSLQVHAFRRLVEIAKGYPHTELEYR